MHKNIIHKILNNNVIIELDESQEEIVIMGKGIGFRKSGGDMYDPALIEKQFTLKSSSDKSMLSDLLAEIPLEVMAATEKIVEQAKRILSVPLNSSVYIALLDHLNAALERYRQGVCLPNSFMWEMKKLYPKEFQAGLEALQIIQTRLHVNLPEDEAGFIAFHLIHAQLNDPTSSVMAITKIVRDILQIVKYHFSMEFDEESFFYQRFVTHLRCFAQRILHNNYIQHSDEALFGLVKNQYEETYQCIKIIDTYLTQTYQHPITSEEKLFLSIHIERLRLEHLHSA